MCVEKDDGKIKSLSPEEKKEKLYRYQVRTLQILLEHKAISEQQFNKSYGDLTVKMGFGTAEEN